MTRDDIIGFVIAEEGGIVDNGADPGGRTNRGITQRYLNAARVSQPDMSLPATVDELTVEQTAELYRRDEWSQIHGDELPPGIALLVMDCAVNSGPARAVKLLQLALGITADGVPGPATLAAANTAPPSLEDEYVARHAVWFASLYDTENVFELGWMRRLVKAFRLAIT